MLLLILTVESELTHGNPGGITRHMLQCLHMWCAQQYTLVLIAAGRLQAAKQFLQQVTSISSLGNVVVLVVLLGTRCR